MHLSRTTRQAYLAMVACVILGGLLGNVYRLPWVMHDKAADDFFSCVSIFSCSCYAGLIMVWMRLLRQRFLNRFASGCLRAAALVLLAWIVVRTIKYEFTEGLPVLRRYLWYSYYVGYTFVPTLLLLASLHIGKRESEGIDRRWWLLMAVAALLLCLVLTNDLHQLAFDFGTLRGPLVHDGDPYAYGPVYFVVVAWALLVSLAVVSVALARVARLTSRRGLALPMGILLVGVLYALVNDVVPGLNGKLPYKDTEVMCFVVVSFMESLVILGLFPVNDFYEEFLKASTLGVGLLDRRGTVVAVANNVPHLTAGQVLEARESAYELGPHERLMTHEVSGGTAFWVRDLSRAHAYQRRLVELGDVLAEENAVLEAENRLARERAAVMHRQAIYNRVGACTQEALARLNALIDDASREGDDFLATMHRAAVEATYVKRCANLILLGEDGSVDVRELALAIRESASWLRECGVDVVVRVSDEGQLSAAEALEAYEAFYRAGRDALEAPCSVSLSCLLGGQGLTVRTEPQGGGES